LTRVRENGEGIALLKGEDEERSGVDKSFKSVLRTWRDVCIQSMRTTIVSQTSGYIAPILPIILCAPKFLDNAMTLGEVMQAASAFAIVQIGAQLARRELCESCGVGRLRPASCLARTGAGRAGACGNPAWREDRPWRG
jgi:hypothetical protein